MPEKIKLSRCPFCGGKADDELVEAMCATPHGDVSFHSEYEAARDYIWDAVSEKFDRDFPCAFVKVQP